MTRRFRTVATAGLLCAAFARHAAWSADKDVRDAAELTGGAGKSKALVTLQ